MSGWDEEQEEDPARRSYTPADAAADAALYRDLKRLSFRGTFAVVALPAALLWWRFPWFAFALAVGALAGAANALLSMHGNERLVEGRNIGFFVLSSFVRLCLFGIVPVVLALRAPSLWTVASYFIGFFLPLALFGIGLKRAYRRKQ